MPARYQEEAPTTNHNSARGDTVSHARPPPDDRLAVILTMSYGGSQHDLVDGAIVDAPSLLACVVGD